MIKTKLVAWLKILFICLIAFVTVKVITPELFLSNTPRINMLFIAKMKNTPKYIASIPSRIGMFFSKKANVASVNKEEIFSKDIASQTVSESVSEQDGESVMKSMVQITPPVNAVFKAISKGVEASEDSSGKVIIKIEKNTPVKYMRYKLPDGRVIDVLDLRGGN